MDGQIYEEDEKPFDIPEDASELYGPYQVMPRYDDEWDVVWKLMNAVRQEDLDHLTVILSRCNPPSGWKERTGAVEAEQNAAHLYRQAKESQGFTNPEYVAAQLATMEDTEIEELLAQDDYDLETDRYFRMTGKSADLLDEADQEQNQHQEQQQEQQQEEMQ